MMKVMSYVWLAATLLACSWDSWAGTVVTNKLTIANGEHWWGGAAGFGTKMPFDGSSAVRIDLTVDNYSQQCDSLLISDQGRIAYSPQVNPGAKVRKVEIPRGRWEGDDGKTVVGPCSIVVTTSLERIPHYVWCAGEDGIVK